MSKPEERALWWHWTGARGGQPAAVVESRQRLPPPFSDRGLAAPKSAHLSKSAIFARAQLVSAATLTGVRHHSWPLRDLQKKGPRAPRTRPCRTAHEGTTNARCTLKVRGSPLCRAKKVALAWMRHDAAAAATAAGPPPGASIGSQETCKVRRPHKPSSHERVFCAFLARYADDGPIGSGAASAPVGAAGAQRHIPPLQGLEERRMGEMGETYWEAWAFSCSSLHGD